MGQIALRSAASTVACVVLSAGLVGVATPSQAETTGTYKATTLVPNISSVRFFIDGKNTSAPATVPTTATITTIDASWSYGNRPYGYTMTVFLCADAANTQCYQVTSPYGAAVSGATRNGITAFQGFPVTTQFHWRAYVDDGKTGTLHAAINPAMIASSPYPGPNLNYTNVNYTY